MPERIQRKRTAGWKLPAGAICVTRPGRFGNPFSVDVFTLDRCLELFRETATGGWNPSILDDAPDHLLKWAYNAHHQWLKRIGGHPVEIIRSELRGHDLACWCALPAPGEPDRCHAVTLIEIANA